jgi:hypothetical protein
VNSDLIPEKDYNNTTILLLDTPAHHVHPLMRRMGSTCQTTEDRRHHHHHHTCGFLTDLPRVLPTGSHHRVTMAEAAVNNLNNITILHLAISHHILPIHPTAAQAGSQPRHVHLLMRRMGSTGQ